MASFNYDIPLDVCNFCTATDGAVILIALVTRSKLQTEFCTIIEFYHAIGRKITAIYR